MAQRIVKRTPSDVGNPIDDIRGIMSLLAPDPDDPLEYLGAGRLAGLYRQTPKSPQTNSG